MSETQSPCVSNCCLDLDDICLGCFRSLEEILHWRDSSEVQKRQILKLCTARGEQRLRGLKDKL